MAVQALGYVGIGSSKLEDWADFAGNVLGMQAVDRGGGMRAFRMDDRKQRLFVDAAMANREQVFGWEVADADALDALAAGLEAAGVTVKREGAALADQRHVTGLISFADPAGNRLEAFHGGHVADKPFTPTRDISGFRTGPMGMGHVLLMVPDVDAAFTFYRDLLGFRLSDFICGPVTAYFTHVNARHHSLALVGGPKRLMHHLLMELYSLDDVGQGYDLAQNDERRVAVKLGRHPNDLMTSFYARSPSDILVEYGWGGLEIDESTWRPEEMDTVASYWGHQGLFESLEEMVGPPPPGHEPPPPMPVPPIRRAPVHVMDGNYERMRGVCPWWDAQKQS
jgi:2,3-dihydroxybiphenyl 1,2-dioxygenase